MKTIRFFSLVVAIAMATGANAQTMKVTANGINMNKLTSVVQSGTGDAFHVVTNQSLGNQLVAGADLIWGCLYTAQPNNPGLFSLTSYSAGFSWYPCFTVRANGNVGIFNANPTQALVVGSAGTPKQVAVNGTIVLGSDSRLKEDIQNLSVGALGKLKGLQGVSYRLKSETPALSIPAKLRNDSSFMRLMQAQPATLQKAADPVATRKHYGFVAQDVQKVFPELVYETDTTGMLSVDYIGMIPVLLEGIKEQQTQIENQQIQIEELQEQLAAVQQILENGGGQLSLARVQEKAVLYQNSPNPFNQSTEIRFYIPTDVQTATIYIYDINGLQKTKYPIAGREEGSITISGATLDAGSYFYTLVCDGAPVASKQMVLTK